MDDDETELQDIQDKSRARKALSDDVEAFLRNGGRVRTFRQGETGSQGESMDVLIAKDMTDRRIKRLRSAAKRRKNGRKKKEGERY
jgi:hypothetical protein